KKVFNADLRTLEYSPSENPLMEPKEVPVKRKRVRSALANRTLLDAETGAVTATAIVHQIEDKDTDEFVKVFAAGISATYELSRTGQRVFQAILKEYEQTPMTRGFADSIYLAWFDGGLSGRKIGMSEYTFKRGLRELLDKGFIAPQAPNVFWVNPVLFFKGDRVMLIREYRRKAKIAQDRDPNTIDMISGQTDAERDS
ncbi:hypothetical protein RDV39_005039, partial [Salmonella enterica]|nr:hypothetical protein [Salmonella enterica]